MAVLIRKCCLVMLLFGTAAISPAYATDLRLEEQEIKAGLLYNFLKYTEWPADHMQESVIVVCMFDGDPFRGYLKPMSGRTVNQRKIILQTVNAVQDTEKCHLILINANTKNLWSDLQDFLKSKPVLTVSDLDQFISSGGMIEFGRRNHHVSVNLNIDAITEAGLRVHERLLKLVTPVNHMIENGAQ